MEFAKDQAERDEAAAANYRDRKASYNACCGFGKGDAEAKQFEVRMDGGVYCANCGERFAYEYTEEMQAEAQARAYARQDAYRAEAEAKCASEAERRASQAA